MVDGIAIITARGGSKRIPQKNIKNFCGRPIIGYTIEAALKSKLFTEVMVSTDNDEIAAVARQYGAKVPFMRSAKTSDDFATTSDVLCEVLAEYEKRGHTFEWLCCIYPTAPFVTAEKLNQSFRKLQEENANALIPVVQFSYPPQRCFVVDNHFLQYKWPEYVRTRSQDLEPFYHDAGQYYFLKMVAFNESKTLVPENTIPFVISDLEAQDIDTLDDWNIAEAKYRLMGEYNNGI